MISTAQSAWVLSDLSLAGGRFRAVLTGPGAPGPVDLCVDGVVAVRVEPVAEGDGRFRLDAPMPEAAVRDGLSAVVFVRAEAGEILATYPLSAGKPLDGDVRAELAALQAELAALKRAFMADGHDRKLRAAERPLIVAEAVEAAEAALRRQIDAPTEMPEPAPTPGTAPDGTPG